MDNSDEKPKAVFFARDYQADFFPFLKSEKYDSVLVTLTKEEKKRIKKKGYPVAACFEEQYDKLDISEFEEDYLETSFSADRYLRFLAILDRRIILGKEITFWRQILVDYDAKIIVNETVAIEISEVLSIEAKKRGVRYLSWMNLSIKNYFYWQTTALHNSLDPKIFNVEPDPKSIEVAQLYIKSVCDGNGRPFYVNNLRGRYSLYLFTKNVYWTLRCLLTEHRYRDKAKNLVFFGDNLPFYIERLISVFNSFIFDYDKIEKTNQLEIIFYPLHYEPEAALFYMAEFFDNQLANIEHLAKCLKHNQILVVKEHPQQPGVLLQTKFRKLKRRVSNLIFLPAEYSTFHLIKRCKLVVTLGSTAGIEALILGKPVAILGKVFYDNYNGVNRLNSFDELKSFMRDERLWKKPDEDLMIRFIAQMVKHSQIGNPFPHQELHSELNVKHIVSAIEYELKKQLKVKPGATQSC